MSNEKYMLTTGSYAGRIGRIELPKDTTLDTCIFYPVEGEYPYRVVVYKKDLVKIS